MNIKHFATKAIGRTALFLKRNKSTILTVLGIGGSAVGTVLACKSTLKLEPLIDQTKKEIDRIHTENPENAKKELTKVYLHTAKELGKLYGLPTALICLSDAMIVVGHVVLRRENAALTAAYIALSESYRKYRERVKELHGEEHDKELMYGVCSEEQMTVDEETGEVKTGHKYYANGNQISIYARFFDESNPNWTKNHEWNLMFLKQVQCWANDKLHANGHIFLNEVYDALGLPRSEAGCICGWVDGIGDSYVDFGVFDVSDPLKRDFINGYERAVLLDFNVDGPIMHIFEHLDKTGKMLEGNSKKKG